MGQWEKAKHKLLAGVLCAALVMTNGSLAGGYVSAEEPETEVVEESAYESEVFTDGSETGTDLSKENTDEEESRQEDESLMESEESKESEPETGSITESEESEESAETLIDEEESANESETLTDEEESANESETESEEGSLEELELIEECELTGVYQFGDAPSEENYGSSAYAIRSARVDDTAGLETYIYEQMLKRNGSIDITSYNIQGSDLTELRSLVKNVIGGVINEHPDLYFVEKEYQYSYMEQGTDKVATTLKITYNDDFDDNAFKGEVRKALSKVQTGMSDLEKAIVLHDYLAVNCEYDKERLGNGTIPQTSYTAYGILVDRIAVCQGYALAYKYLLNQVGIECYMVTSDEMNHAWNLIELDGKYYQVDVTWADPVWDLIGRVRHEYMFRSDNAFTNTCSEKHHGWSITKGIEVVDYEATDTTYDSAFWLKVDAPLVFWGNDCYYVSFVNNTGGINKTTLPDITGTGETICDIGQWNAWEGNGYYSGVYSGLFQANNRLYYNDKSAIYSIALDASENEPNKRTEFTADTTNGYIYGSAFCQGKVLYSLHQTPNLTEKETVLTADITIEEEPVEVPVEKIELDKETLDLTVGDTAKLTAVITPEYTTNADITWSSSDSSIAKVENGTVTALAVGTCTITASADGKEAVCKVTVKLEDTPIEGDKPLEITGITVADKTIYNGRPIQVGTASVKTADGTDVTDSVTLIYTYSGTQADDSTYTDKNTAPTNAGTYSLTVSVAENKDGYTGTLTRNFTITKASLTITARSMEIKTGAQLPSKAEYKYDMKGIAEGDKLITEPTLTCNIADTTKAGTYDIIASGANAGMNYEITYQKGTLTVKSESAPTIPDDGHEEDKTLEITGITVKNETVYNGRPIQVGTASAKTADGTDVTNRVTLAYAYSGIQADGSAYTAANTAPTNAGTYSLTVSVAANQNGYTGTLTRDFTITKAPLTITARNMEIQTGDRIPSKEAYKYDVTGLVSGDKLVAEPSLTCNIADTANAGTYDIIASGANAGMNYEIVYKKGILTVRKTEETADPDKDKDDSPYTDAERMDLGAVGAVADIKDKVFDGEAYEPVVKITATTADGKKTTLTEGADYRIVDYQNNINAGQGRVVVRGNGIYKGEIVKTFTIKQKPMKGLKVLASDITGNIGDMKITQLSVHVYDGTKCLNSETDYALSNMQPTKNGVQVTVTGKGNYEGSAFAKIAVYESGTQLITPENVTLQSESMAGSYAYTGKAVKPAVTVKVGGVTLTSKDYKVQYQNNKNAGTAYAIVTGKGTYKGKAVVPFTIRAETGGLAIKPISDKTFNGKPQKPTVSVTINKDGKARKLSKKDYSVAYKSNFHAGKASVIITGKGNYAGLSATAEFKINPQQIKKASLKGVRGALVLTYNKRNLKEGTDYETPQYGTESKNKVPVTITGKGDFTGELSKNVKVQ